MDLVIILSVFSPIARALQDTTEASVVGIPIILTVGGFIFEFFVEKIELEKTTEI